MIATPLVDDGSELRRALVEELRSSAEDVRSAIGNDKLVHAVHDYRKALRRSRAILRLIAAELPKSDRREIRRALTDARRALSATRDHAVANDVLGQLDAHDIRDYAKAAIDSAAASALSSAEVRQLLAEGAARTAAQVELIDAALPPRIELRTIIEGVRTTYAQARRARRAAKRSRHAFHTWRRRSKELGIQLELLARIANPEIETVRKQIADATADLGESVDLLMARDFVRLHHGVVGEQGVLALTQLLEAQLDEKTREGRRAARDVFHKKPRVFAKRLAKLARPNAAGVAAPPLMRSEEFAMT